MPHCRLSAWEQLLDSHGSSDLAAHLFQDSSLALRRPALIADKSCWQPFMTPIITKSVSDISDAGKSQVVLIAFGKKTVLLGNERKVFDSIFASGTTSSSTFENTSNNRLTGSLWALVRWDRRHAEFLEQIIRGWSSKSD